MLLCLQEVLNIIVDGVFVHSECISKVTWKTDFWPEITVLVSQMMCIQHHAFIVPDVQKPSRNSVDLLLLWSYEELHTYGVLLMGIRKPAAVKAVMYNCLLAHTSR